MNSPVVDRIGETLKEEESGDALRLSHGFLKTNDCRYRGFSKVCCEEELLLELDLVDVKYWVDAAIGYYRACGEEVALTEFSNPVGRFVKDEMYIFALDMAGRMIAHGADIDCVGRDFHDVSDAVGNSFVKFIVETANEQGYGWVEYMWFNPRSGRDEPKMTYFEKCDDVIVCCGLHL